MDSKLVHDNKPWVYSFPRNALTEFLYRLANQQAVLWTYGLSVIASVSLVLLHPEQLALGPLEWRAWGAFNGHHLIMLYLITGVFFYFTRVYKFVPAYAVVSVWLMISVHEIEWWAADVVNIYAFHPLPGFSLYYLGGWIEIAAAVTLFIWFLMSGPSMWRFWVKMGVFYVAWLAIGFPVTVNFTGLTPWYSLAWVSGVEVLSWLYAAWAFLSERKTLRAHYDRLMGMSNGIDNPVKQV